MKKALILFFHVTALTGYGQFHLEWKGANKDVSFLKQEKKLNIIVSFDSLRIDSASLERPEYSIPPYETPKDLSGIIKSTIITYFNKVKKRKLSVVSGVDSLNYTLKITPLFFYGEKVFYSGTGAPSFSIYFKGDYLVELYLKSELKPVRSFRLLNLTNPGPKCEYYSRYKPDHPYKGKATYETVITINSKRAGTEIAKYLIKLNRKPFF